MIRLLIILLLVFLEYEGLAQEIQVSLGNQLITNMSSYSLKDDVEKKTFYTYDVGINARITKTTKKLVRYSIASNLSTYSFGLPIYSDTLKQDIKYINRGILLEVMASIGHGFAINENLNAFFDIGISVGKLYFKENTNSTIVRDSIQIKNLDEKTYLIVRKPIVNFQPFVAKISSSLGFEYRIEKKVSISVSYNTSIILNPINYSILNSTFVFDSNRYERTEDHLVLHSGNTTYLSFSCIYKI